MQLRSATLGKIFPGRVFPGLPSVVAQGARQRNFFAESPMQYARQLWEKIFPGRVFLDLPSVVAQGARQRIFLKKLKTVFADGLARHARHRIFSKKNRKTNTIKS
jgi:hypothetical protein